MVFALGSSLVQIQQGYNHDLTSNQVCPTLIILTK